jgi:hypothetical protein
MQTGSKDRLLTRKTFVISENRPGACNCLKWTVTAGFASARHLRTCEADTSSNV